jgi:hypothetical protein
LANRLDWGNNTTVYIILPASLSKEPFRGEVKPSDCPYDGRNGKKSAVAIFMVSIKEVSRCATTTVADLRTGYSARTQNVLLMIVMAIIKTSLAHAWKPSSNVGKKDVI